MYYVVALGALVVAWILVRRLHRRSMPMRRRKVEMELSPSNTLTPISGYLLGGKNRMLE